MLVKNSLRVTLGCLALFAIASCGDTTGERAATGAIGGAVIAGPPGAVVGGTAGAVIE